MGKETALANLPTRYEFSAEQRQMIRTSFASGASDSEFAVLMEVARARNLNPLLGQIHFVKRWTQERGEVWSFQVSIDGFRAIADRTGKYDGQDEPEFEYDEKAKVPRLARVKVYRKDWQRPAIGVAHFSEYAQTKKDGSLNRMWATKPHIMLAKCAEALGFRKAFPEDTSGLYVPEELPDDTRHYEPDEPLPVNYVETYGKRMKDAPSLDELKAVGAEIGKDVPKTQRGVLEKIYAVRRAELTPERAKPKIKIKGEDGREITTSSEEPPPPEPGSDG